MRAVVLDNVQFIYELALAELELRALGSEVAISNGLREFELGNATAELQERLVKRTAYFQTIGGQETDYSRIIRRNRTKSVNQYLTHWIYPYKGKFHPQMVRALLNVIGLERGDTVLDPFIGSGTTLVAAQELNRNAVGFDLQERYIQLCQERLITESIFNQSQQIAINDDARNIPRYIEPGTVSLIWTSPPYADMLNKRCFNLSRRDPKSNEHYGKVKQYSQDPRDLGTMPLEEYTQAMGEIFETLRPLLKPNGHCVINILNPWFNSQRVTISDALISELRKRGYEFRNTIIWNKTNLLNRVGIFGYPSNYITRGNSFEYLLDFIVRSE